MQKEAYRSARWSSANWSSTSQIRSRQVVASNAEVDIQLIIYSSRTKQWSWMKSRTCRGNCTYSLTELRNYSRRLRYPSWGTTLFCGWPDQMWKSGHVIITIYAQSEMVFRVHLLLCPLSLAKAAWKLPWRVRKMVLSRWFPWSISWVTGKSIR